MRDLFASADLGGTNIHAALADADGSIVCEEKIPTASHGGPERVLERISELVDRLAVRPGQGRAPSALAFRGWSMWRAA